MTKQDFFNQVKSGKLVIRNGKVYTPEICKDLDDLSQKVEHFDLLQLTKKISLNSLYGALLNKNFRFSRTELGASVTGSGRQITIHMLATLNELVGADYTAPKKKSFWENGELHNTYEFENKDIPCIYSDTDSAYVQIKQVNSVEEAVFIADGITEILNERFPLFLRDAFLCQPDFDAHIKAGREIVARRMLLQAKKKYICKVVDLEGQSVDKMKSMGSEIKKADTPKIIQVFLKTTVDKILDGVDYDSVATFVNEQRREILKKKLNVFLLGVAKQVNNLDKYAAEYANPGSIRTESGKKLTIPGHARAACNHNHLLDHFDRGSKAIRSGDKVLIYYLKPNQFKFDSIAFPAELSRFPAWFTENFQVDIKKTEDRMFDSKLNGIFSAWGHDVPTVQSVFVRSILEF